MQWTVDTRHGPIPAIVDEERKPTVVILAHGAGGHMEQKTMVWLAGLVGEQARVVRFNFLYKAQGRSMPDRMPVLVETYRSVIDRVRHELAPARLIIGGHSMGGRTATMLEAESHSADGLLLFGYPLHPAGQPEKLRDAHLASIKVPVLQLSGTEDPLCTREIMERLAGSLDPKVWTLRWIEGADHSYTVKKSTGRGKGDVEEDIRGALGEWLTSRS